MADTADLKSAARKSVPVQVRVALPIKFPLYIGEKKMYNKTSSKDIINWFPTFSPKEKIQNCLFPMWDRVPSVR